MPQTDFAVLLVCTANLCRSPMGEYLLLDALKQRGGAAQGDWRVESAGTRAQAGSRMHPLASAVLSERSVAHDGFRSRQVTAELVDAADLVLTASREHRRSVVELAPKAVRRTFTLRQFARLAGVMSPRATADVTIADHLISEVPAARARLSPHSPGDDDLADPIGGKIADFRRCADTVSASLAVIAARLALPN